jgi:putative ABC transport system substrate-binding protein
MNASDPVKAGLVASLSRPGGNVTGITDMGSDLATKRLGLLHELLPAAERFAALLFDNTSNLSGAIEKLRTAAESISLQMDAAGAKSSQEIDDVFAAFAQKRVEGLWVGPGALFLNCREQITSLAARYAIPAVYPLRAFTEVGGLMSYGSNIADRGRQAGSYVGRILKGEKPADLPVMRNTKFELIINLKTARALRINVPVSLLTIADEVLE